MAVLVTGGAGYIGAHVVRCLRDRGEVPVVVDDLSTGRRDRVGDARLVVLDLAADGGVDSLAALMVETGVDAVVHLAAKKHVGESVRYPARYYRQNVTGLANLLEAMESASVRNLVFSSSAAVYGTPDGGAVDESSPTRPVNPYGETKLVGEWLVRDAAQAFGLGSISLRYFNVAGAATPELGDPAILNLVTMVLDRITRGERPLIFGTDYPTPDGTCVRDFVHVEDLAESHLAAVDRLRSGPAGLSAVYNVGTGRGASVLDMVDRLLAVSGSALEPEFTARRLGDPPAVVARAGRIETELGWRARLGLGEIVDSAWAAWQARRPE